MSPKHILLFAVLLFVAREGFCQCPSNQTFESSCYVIPHAEADWIGAVRYCKALGGNLASLDTRDEHNFVASLINSTSFSRSLLFQTPNHYQYRYLHDSGVSVVGHSSVTFMVQACNDAHLGLSSSNNSHHETYEIVIGGWSDSESVIRDCMQCAHMDEVRQQDHPLNCSGSRPFWLSWQDGIIRLGTGLTLGENQMLSWEDPSPHPVNYLGISTGWGSTGVWSFLLNTYRPGQFWLGTTDLQVEGEWNRLPDLEEIEFTLWAPGQPSGQWGRHCAAMDSARGLQWIDADCEFRRNFVCELNAVER